MTVVAKTQHLLSAEDLFKADVPERNVELIEGELVVMTPPGWEHNEIAVNFYLLFHEFCRTHSELHALPDNTGFRMQRDPDIVFCPDASLFRRRSRTKGVPWLDFPPDLAVEVLSPGNTSSDIILKRNKYFELGTEQVWVVDPKSQTVEFCFSDGRKVVVQGNESVRGQGIASGMEIDLEKIFLISES